jgi:hypothetical protein
MRFFSQFPKVPYSFDQFIPSINTQIIDIYRYVDVNRDITSDLSSYLTYSIKDGERPDQVSHKLYKTPDFHWTFFVINELLKDGINNWPKSYIELDDYLRKTYGPYSVLEFLPEQIFNEDGDLAQYNNYFGRIEFDGRIKMIRNESDGKNLKAVPVFYDHQKLQLWVEDVESSFLTNDDATYNLIYEGSKKQKLAWADEFGLPWCKESYPEIYQRLTDETTIIDDDIQPFSRGVIEFRETARVFDESERTVDMFDIYQDFDISESPQPTTYGWEDSSVDDDETNDDYEENYTFYRGALTFVAIEDDDASPVPPLPQRTRPEDGDLDPTQIWVSDDGSFLPVDWNGKTAATPALLVEVDEPYKSEWYPYGTDALGVFFMEKYLPMIKFKTQRSYVEAFNAPQSYADSEDTRITTYDALRADINNSNYTTYYEYENNENEAKRDIVVLRESAVEPFAERYEELLNE